MSSLTDWLGLLLVWGGLALAVTKLVSGKIAWLLIAVGDAVLSMYDFAAGRPIWAGINAALAAFAIFVWYHSKDDDDDRGKRLRSWVKSKLAKPVVVQVRRLSTGDAR